MKKLGKFLLCYLPMLTCIWIQMCVSMIGMFILGTLRAAELAGQGIEDQELITKEVTTAYMNHIDWILIATHAIIIITFVTWYYFGCGRPKAAKIKSVMTVNNVLGTVMVSLGLQFFISAGLIISEKVFPEQIAKYEEMMENAGLTGDFSLAIMIVTVLMAPIGEEVLCRGIILYYAKRVSNKFIIVNLIQAVAFGIMHLNLVQGIYAFLMGLVFGLLYEKVQSLYLCMFAHFIVNGCNFVLSPIYEMIPETILCAFFIMIPTGIVILLGLKLVGRPCKTIIEV